MTKMPLFTSSLVSLCCIFLLAFQKHTAARNLPNGDVQCAPVSTILVFGDSTGDSGNNNNLLTAYKSNFYPYGKDFPDHKATGRFTNGRLMTDFIANNLGVKEYVPPAMDMLLCTDDLKTGVTFASAASGYDSTTSTLNNVISLTNQLIHFHGYKARLMLAIGVDETNKLIDNALFIVSAGTNDFILNYPVQRTFNTLKAYMCFLIKETRKVLQTLIDQGARHIGVVGLPPIGCLPFVITLYSPNPLKNRDCISNLSSVAQDYNKMLQAELKNMQLESKTCGARLAYLDSYKPLEGMISGNKKGFDKVDVGCCGTGLLEAGYFCNPLSPVCKDTTKYLFWDSVHPTEKAYSILSKTFMPAINSLYKN